MKLRPGKVPKQVLHFLSNQEQLSPGHLVDEVLLQDRVRWLPICGVPWGERGLVNVFVIQAFSVFIFDREYFLPFEE